MEDQVKTLGAMLIVSGCANILLSILLFLQDRSWVERYANLASRVHRSKNQPEPPEPQKIAK